LATLDKTSDRLREKMLQVRGQQASVSDLLGGMIALKASEMFLKTGSGLRFKVGGRVKAVPSEKLTKDHMTWIQRCFLGEKELLTLAERGVADVVYQSDKSRYCLHFAYGHTGPYATVRIIGQDIPAFEELGLPITVQKQMMGLRSGLFVVCGSTDAGKTVTCTSFLNTLNQNRELAILTLEDPIEFIFDDNKSWFLQREVGLHVDTFADGVKSALRENVDVIFVGEMRDNRTIEQVLRAAEMGHLVISTLHADDAMSALSRIIGSFPQADQPRIRQSLANTLVGIVYQRLLPGKKTARIPCCEAFWPNTAMRNNPRQGDLSKMLTYIGPQTGLTYPNCLLELFRSGQNSPEAHQEEQERLRAQG
jgi:twitching motility protein PilT